MRAASRLPDPVGHVLRGLPQVQHFGGRAPATPPVFGQARAQQLGIDVLQQPGPVRQRFGLQRRSATARSGSTASQLREDIVKDPAQQRARRLAPRARLPPGRSADLVPDLGDRQSHRFHEVSRLPADLTGWNKTGRLPPMTANCCGF